MFALTEMWFIGLVLEGFLYGLYSGMFAMYLQIQTSKKDSGKMQNIIFYSICALYALSIVIFGCDITIIMHQLLGTPNDSSVVLRIFVIETTTLGCCDFIAQLILIYRCWIVWGCKFRVVIIPTLLAFVFLGTWLASNDSVYVSSDQLVNPPWTDSLAPASLALSLTVNALVTGLIVLRIFKVFREVKATLDDQILGVSGGNKLRSVIFVLIESGMTLFAIQLAYLVVDIVETEAALQAYVVIGLIYDMLIGITPTIILVRTSLGLSFHDEKSMEEAVIGSLHFASDNPNSVTEIGSIGMVGQESGDDDIIEVQRSSDIGLVDR